MKTTATTTTVREALNEVNARFGYKLEFNRLDTSGTRKVYTNFTLKTKSGIPGARFSASGRNIAKASWHSHGHIFDEILKREPDAIIWSAGKKIDANGGNWQDYNINSYSYPVMFSKTSIL